MAKQNASMPMSGSRRMKKNQQTSNISKASNSLIGNDSKPKSSFMEAVSNLIMEDNSKLIMGDNSKTKRKPMKRGSNLMIGNNRKIESRFMKKLDLFKKKFYQKSLKRYRKKLRNVIYAKTSINKKRPYLQQTEAVSLASYPSCKHQSLF